MVTVLRTGEESGRDDTVLRTGETGQVVTVLRTIPPIAVQEREYRRREWERCQVVTVLCTIPPIAVQERCQVVTVLRTIPPIAVQEKRVGEMSGGDCPPYDTSHSSTGGEREWETTCLYDTSHSSTGEESGRDVRW